MTGVTVPGVGMAQFRSKTPHLFVELVNTAATRALPDANIGTDIVT